jgi:pleiotropic regulator 1
MAIHPTLDVIVTGGRDSTVRVWDIRTKRQVQCFEGHTNSVFQVATQAPDPQIVSVSADSQVRLWDLAAGKCRSVLTNHKKGVRAVVIHPEEFSMATASADNIKKWKFPDGHFMENMTGHRAVINTLAMNQDGVMVSGADNGTLAFWDWKSSYKFQDAETIVQPGSLASEAGIFQAAFDMTGSRLITCEADKTIKIWKEDEDATPETHPIHWTKTVVKDKF